ncbi:SDR family oxidoreductase [Pseudomaricurvus alkylphenolicus]|jgi:meso-butanediol dehydrogenase/(S,S)-butanediol dehydrogenase/diacetyl reductase|uniref:SDR family NAD(P)-dependent oxidoreductase n=1 Tax=Pseudomaricurvus alkylphenolicus TaxID=1306991 RepID=UPI0014217A0B|nr:SDR family oxidoreductase [Pseudomaricurvus alkylphenolicus]NIB37977.1 SDR family oxidoreductase [Pseudomaricurvus alkylphenolicus]
MKQFTGKVALVTGAASGMGQSIAIRLAGDGATVVAADIDTEGLEATVAKIREAGDQVTAHHYDAASESSCTQLVQQAIKLHGQLDIVANVAGIAGFYHLHETTTELFERYLAINLTSVLVICREAMPHLKESRGCIINFASINARMPVAYHAAYDASKAGVLALTKSMAQEFSEFGVRCNSICPGGFDTPMNKNLRWAEGMDFKLIAKLHNPKIPMAHPDRIAGVAAFLASEDASHVNGEQIIVDAGVSSII